MTHLQLESLGSNDFMASWCILQWPFCTTETKSSQMDLRSAVLMTSEMKTTAPSLIQNAQVDW